MDEDKKLFRIPGFNREQARDFRVNDENLKIYEELNAINEEIEKCRLRNC